MQCPHCYVSCFEDDPVCYKCLRPFHTGLKHSNLLVVCGLIFTLGTMGLLIAFIPMNESDGIMLNAMTVGVKCAGAGVFGYVLGWAFTLFTRKS